LNTGVDLKEAMYGLMKQYKLDEAKISNIIQQIQLVNKISEVKNRVS
jgi:hypothetical protein